MYQIIDEQNEYRREEVEEEKEMIKTSFSSWLSRILTLSIIISMTFIVSFGFSSNTSINHLTKSSKISKVSKISTLDTIPKDTIYGSLNSDDQHHLFELFLKQYGRSYPRDQYESRFQIFLQNIGIADSRNKEESDSSVIIASKDGAIHGVTKFSAYTPKELASMKIKLSRSELKENQIPVAKINKYNGPLKSVDWTGILTTRLKDQGLCGSCWAFSVSSQVESDAILAKLLTVDDSLSAQQILTCERGDSQCDGGFTENGFAYAKEKGLELESTYPYVSILGTAPKSCHYDSFKTVIKVTSFSTLDNEQSMIDYVLSTGPLSVCVDSTTWSTYIGGILSSCPSDNIDHCVQIVGVNAEEGYWIVRNTWGSDWGENGYIRLAIHSNQCGITTDPIFSSVVAVKQSENI